MNLLSNILSAVFFLSFSITLAQNNKDTSILNQSEKKYFNLSTDSIDIVPLLLAIDTTIDIDHYIKRVDFEIKEITDYFETKQLHKKSRKKQIRELNKLVYNKLFKKYDENTFFSHIFQNGTFNCVTGTAFYALILDRLGIPYEIQETITHVYLIAFPHSDKIYLETTNGSSGNISLDYNFKKRYVEFLENNKLISEEDFSNHNLEEVFDKYYFKGENKINLLQLAGLQYFNNGIEAINNSNWDKAVINLEKHNALYPSEVNNNLMLQALIQIVHKEQNNDQFQSENLLKICQITGPENYKSLIHNYKIRMDEQLVRRHPNPIKYEEILSPVLAVIEDSAFKTEITTDFHIQMAYMYQDSNLKFALKHIKLACASDSTHDFMQKKFLYIVGNDFNKRKHEKGILNEIDSILKNYPFLGNTNMKNLYLYICSYRGLNAYKYDNGRKGNLYLNKMRDFLKKHNYIDYEQEVIASIYGEACAFQYRQKNYSKGKRILQEGISLAPDNDFLKNRYEIVRKSGY